MEVGRVTIKCPKVINFILVLGAFKLVIQCTKAKIESLLVHPILLLTPLL